MYILLHSCNDEARTMNEGKDCFFMGSSTSTVVILFNTDFELDFLIDSTNSSFGTLAAHLV